MRFPLPIYGALLLAAAAAPALAAGRVADQPRERPKPTRAERIWFSQIASQLAVQGLRVTDIGFRGGGYYVEVQMNVTASQSEPE